MKYLGIDYGSKRIGIAVSDEDGAMAFPRTVLENKKGVLDAVVKIITDEGVGEMVIGSSTNQFGHDNPIMEQIQRFATDLGNTANIPVHFESEAFSSFEAARNPGKPTRSADRRDDQFKSGGSVDASAATIILQRYLDRQNSKNT